MSDARSACKLCGGPMRRNTLYGICSKTAGCRAAGHRAYRAAHPEKGRERWRKHRTRLRREGCEYYQRNRVPVLADMERKRRLAGSMPLEKQRGVIHPSWKGGKYISCHVCGFPVYKVPIQIKRCKSGKFYCAKHRGDPGDRNAECTMCGLPMHIRPSWIKKNRTGVYLCGDKCRAWHQALIKNGDYDGNADGDAGDNKNENRKTKRGHRPIRSHLPGAIEFAC